MEYNINEDHLSILMYGGTSKDKLIYDYKKISSDLSMEIKYFEEEILKDELFTYKIKNLEQLKDFFIDRPKLQQLNMEYKYCKNLSGSYQGFVVNIEQDIFNINSSITFINSLVFDLMSNDLNCNDLINKNNILTNTLGKYISSENKNDFKLTQNTDLQQFESKIVKSIIDFYFIELNLWVNAYSIQKTYRECYDNKEILFFSHRINGWSSPVCILNNKLSAEYKTNFGYGKSSYFYVKLKYDDIEIIPFCDLVKYEHANFFQINQYTKKFDKIDNNDWEEALIFLADAYNTLIEGEDKFIKKYMIDEINNLVDELGCLMKKDHFKFVDAPLDVNTGEIKERKFTGSELIVFRAKKITSALDFILKIKEYNNIMEVDSAINKIEGFNRFIKGIIKNEVGILGKKSQDLFLKKDEITPRYTILKESEDEFIKSKILIRKNLTIDKLEDKIEERINIIFLSKNPGYIFFKKEYDGIKKKYDDLSKEIEKTKNLIMQLNMYYSKIITYF